MSYEAKPVFFYAPARSTPQIKNTIDLFLEKWLPMHSLSDDLILYHYTNLEGLKGILKSRSIWFTHTSTLNDPSELKYGKELILNILNEAIGTENDEFIKSQLKVSANFINAFDTMSYHSYVACFCESENLLSQWRGYAAQGGGFNLGLKFCSETKFYHDIDNFEDESYVLLRKVIYDIDKQKELVSNYISSIVSSSKDAIKWFSERGGIPEAWDSISAMEIVNILFDLMLSFKNPVFREENEWRLIEVMEAKHKPERLKFREAKEELIPYLETFIAEDLEGKPTFPLQMIKYGPMRDEARMKSVLELLINKEAASENKINIHVNSVKISGAGYVLRD